ncbi:MAG: 5-bromo-4-chloroindolyl phosphate hydrolysis family protein [Clostridiales bacterium]|nr:5-bromo-4-chloroindolyl phosphate hydrolysis family protein [Candidatus Blautia equi]
MKDKDMKNLGDTIQDALEDARVVVDKVNEIIGIYQDERSFTTMVNKTISQYRASMPKRAEQARMAEIEKYNQIPALYAAVKSFRTSSILKIVFGGILGGLTLSGLLAGLLVALVAGTGSIGFVPLFLLAGLSAWLLLSGIKGVTRVSRFKKYLRKLGDKTYATLKTLGSAVGKPDSFVRDDIKYMVDNNWFPEGHMDYQETMLITSEETYEQYLRTTLRSDALRKEKEEQQQAQAAAKSAPAAGKELSPEVKAVLDKGNAYLERIHVLNIAIPGEDITAKINRMENIVDQIFQRAQEHPEIIRHLQQMMDYYLPTAIKLLEAYADMDAQSYQGENVKTMKQNIETTIDTLNLAFEKLMDSVFQETVWDVNSDISVLNTLLAQEGLTEDGMTMETH